MNEKLSDQQSAFDLVRSIFQRAYEPGSNINIGSLERSEIIKGIQENGSRIALIGSGIDVENDLIEEPVFQVVVAFEARSSIINPPEVYERRYFLLAKQESSLTFEIIKTDPLTSIVVGSGEVDDLRNKIQGADFSVES